jgi:hypothetical protein
MENRVVLLINVLTFNQPVLDSVVENLDYKNILIIGTIIDLTNPFYQNILKHKSKPRFDLFKSLNWTQRDWEILSKIEDANLLIRENTFFNKNFIAIIYRDSDKMKHAKVYDKSGNLVKEVDRYGEGYDIVTQFINDYESTLRTWKYSYITRSFTFHCDLI